MSNESYHSTTYFLEHYVEQLGCIVYEKDGKRSYGAYFAFLNFPILIEYMGACRDSFDFNTDARSKKRFDDAIINVFGQFRREYKTYGNPTSKYYLYNTFRCSLVHQLRPTGGVVFTTRKEASAMEIGHMQINEDEKLVMILEDLYEDTKKACGFIINEFKKGYNTKGDKNFLKITSYDS